MQIDGIETIVALGLAEGSGRRSVLSVFGAGADLNSAALDRSVLLLRSSCDLFLCLSQSCFIEPT